MKRNVPPAAFFGIILILVAILGGAYAVIAQPQLNAEQREEYSDKQIFRRKKPKAGVSQPPTTPPPNEQDTKSTGS